jgi:hypothetical protein
VDISYRAFHEPDICGPTALRQMAIRNRRTAAERAQISAQRKALRELRDDAEAAAAACAAAGGRVIREQGRTQQALLIRDLAARMVGWHNRLANACTAALAALDAEKGGHPL